jgi:MinD superfamily P-loop ATPase
MAADPFVLAIASGKGGTGKTLIATNVAVQAAESANTMVVLADCDVEAPNDHLFVRREEPVVTTVEVLFAEVDSSLCDACGACRDACAYGAIRVLGASALVFDELCHGCGVCRDVCPNGAISEVSRRVGELVVGDVAGHDGLSLVTGTLDIAQVKAPSVIRSVRAAASSGDADLIVLDAPPGVACSAVTATRGADGLLLVTEPTAFGAHDLELSLRLARSLDLPTAVVVNRDQAGGPDIDTLCDRYGAPIIARIPFDRRIAEIYARGGLVAEELPEFRALFAEIPRAMRDIARAARQAPGVHTDSEADAARAGSSAADTRIPPATSAPTSAGSS